MAYCYVSRILEISSLLLSCNYIDQCINFIHLHNRNDHIVRYTKCLMIVLIYIFNESTTYFQASVPQMNDSLKQSYTIMFIIKSAIAW